MAKGENTMSNAIVFQKLETIKIVQTDPTPITLAAANFRADPDVGNFRSMGLGLRVGEQMGFASQAIWIVRFDDHVKLSLRQENNFGHSIQLGSVTVPSSELDLGERSFHFTESGAHVVLTYFVRDWPQ